METKVTPDQWVRIKIAYENGKTCTKLSEKYGISITRISTKLRKMGTIMRPFYFQKGCNVWNNLSKKATEKRKKEFSIRMSKYNPMKNRITAEKVAKKLKEKLGIKNPNYKHGLTSWKVLGLTFKQKIKFLQDNKNVCVNCKEQEPITVHHIDGDRGNNCRKNLMVLCANCHYKIHYGVKPLSVFLLKLRKKLLPKELIRRRYKNGEKRYKEFE